MKTYPLHSISLEQAKQLQFKVIDAVTRNFQGEEVLSLGDLERAEQAPLHGKGGKGLCRHL